MNPWIVLLGVAGATMVGWSTIGMSLNSRFYSKKHDLLIFIAGMLLMLAPFLARA
ncbi:MAG: hypothetical protein Q7K16_01275 [Candidatus Azambacteria bacterium]|nr:hypothetical protein [Candidatus Azambacteria bacterium]